jgi:hypothetical protein
MTWLERVSLVGSAILIVAAVVYDDLWAGIAGGYFLGQSLERWIQSADKRPAR